jgi:hypothetical protein
MHVRWINNVGLQNDDKSDMGRGTHSWHMLQSSTKMICRLLTKRKRADNAWTLELTAGYSSSSNFRFAVRLTQNMELKNPTVKNVNNNVFTHIGWFFRAGEKNRWIKFGWDSRPTIQNHIGLWPLLYLPKNNVSLHSARKQIIHLLTLQRCARISRTWDRTLAFLIRNLVSYV